MSNPARKYEKLPGKTAGVMSVARLWAEEDHLLVVNNWYGVETYQRFYFRDLQALVIRRTRAALYWSLVWGALAVAFGALAATFWFLRTNTEVDNAFPALAAFTGSLSAIFVVCLLVNMLLGASCTLMARTVTGWQPLAAPKRVRPARRVLNILGPRILQAQNAPAPAGEALRSA